MQTTLITPGALVEFIDAFHGCTYSGRVLEIYRSHLVIGYTKANGERATAKVTPSGLVAVICPAVEVEAA